MDHIETAILNCYGIREAEQNMVFAARLTQHGHTIQNMADLMDLYRQSYSQKTVENIAGLPHPTVQKFMVITVAVVGASRRFLTQITSTSSQTIHKDTRVGQLVITPVVIADFVLNLGEERGTGAFGSTGE